MTNFGPVNTLAINTSRRTTTASAYAQFVNDIKRQAVFFMELTQRDRTDQGALFAPPAGVNVLPVNVTRNSANYLPTSATILYSSRNWIGRPNDPLKPNVAAKRRLITAFRIRRSTPYYPTEDNRIQTTVANATLDNTRRDLDAIVHEKSIEATGAPIYHGPLNGFFSDAQRIAVPTVRGAETSDDEIRLQFLNTEDLFSNVALQSARYNGNGGLGGDVGLRGSVKPFVFGDVFNMPPTLINQLLFIYQVHSGRVSGIGPVWEGASAVTFDQDYESYAALAVATIPSGHYATCKALGLFRLSQAPTKKITASVRGDATANFYVQDSGAIIFRALTLIAKRSTATLDIASFSLLSKQPIGWYNERKEYTVAEFINLILHPENAVLGEMRTGKIGIIKHLPLEDTITAKTIRIRPSQIEAVLSTEAPMKSEIVHYGWNWSPFTSEDDFVDSVPELERDRFRDQSLVARSTSGRVSALRDDAVNAEKISWWTEAAGDAAQEQADIDMQLYGRTRLRYKLTVGRKGFSIKDGQVFNLYVDRFGFENGAKVAAIDFDESARGEQVIMEVLA